MLCTSLAILQLSGVKLPRALLWTSGYSDWSLSEKVSTRYRRFFHLTLLRSFKACKPPTSFFFFSATKQLQENIPQHASIQGNHVSTIQKSAHLAENTQLMMCRLSATILMCMVPSNRDLRDKDDVSSVIKRQSFTTGRGKKKKKSSLCPSPQKARSTALGKPAAASYQKSRLMS